MSGYDTQNGGGAPPRPKGRGFRAVHLVKRASDLGLSDDQLMRALIGVAGVMIGHASGGDDQVLAENVRNLSAAIETIALASALGIQEEA